MDFHGEGLQGIAESLQDAEGMWGLLEHKDKTSTPKYDALASWINVNPK